ncbi:LysE family translocator [Actinomadura parmotrematis]|uniref:LysE family translocator n=1 Tax=Actinomadura parmotrematis TaxID=2864039 RepID=A0ABS7FW89_9ACTN|nr:LysE family translocator [Actinomadura parmotrematis]MBW8484699.1 LysE family translocator [Actinomadura parmotrematis]
MSALVFLGASLLLALTPGANNLLALQNAIRHGRRLALGALAGRLAAFAIMITAVAAGLGPLLARSERVLTTIKWLGVAYLLYLGARTLWDALRRPAPDAPAEDAPADAPGLRPLARKEFLVAITNPKALLIFTAFLPQFIDPGMSAPLQFAWLGPLYLLAESLAATAYCLLGGALKAMRTSRAFRRRLDQGTGAVLLGLAALLAADH